MIDVRHRNTALLVAGCFFMEMLDGTIVTTAAPALGRSLGVPPTAISLVITAYLLALAVLIPLSGWLTRRLGVRPVFLSAIAVFTLASLGCALSGSLGTLVAMRVVQGAGGAMMVPVGRMLMVARTEKKDLLRIMAYIVWPGLISPVIAPIAGALIISHASWRWIFLINIPLGMIAFAVAWRLIDNEEQAAPPPLDWPGLLLTCAGLGGITYAAHLVADTDAGWRPITALAVGSLILLAVAVRHLLHTPHPLVGLHTLASPTFRVSQLGGSLYWLVVGAAPFLLPLLFQTVFGWSPVRSGAVVLFIFAGNVGIKPATTPLINRFGFRTVLLAATLGLALSMVMLGFTTAATPLWIIALLTLVSGICRSAGLTVYSTVGFTDLPPDQIRDANTLSATTTQLCAGLAVAVATVALRAGRPLGELLPGRPGPGTPFTMAFGLFGLIALMAGIEAFRLHPSAGDAARRMPGAAGVPDRLG